MEDDAQFGELLKDSLELNGFDVRLAPDATTAAALYEQSPADIFISDIIVIQSGKPVSDGGITAIWRIKSLAQRLGHKTLIIAVSGAFSSVGTANLLATAKQVGAHEALEKPFSPQDLLEKIMTSPAMSNTVP